MLKMNVDMLKSLVWLAEVEVEMGLRWQMQAEVVVWRPMIGRFLCGAPDRHL